MPGRTVALAAAHTAAVAAGRRAAEAGGNALDAALAAAAALTVVYPHQCAIGGDLIALVRDPRGRTTAIVAAGTAPARIDEVSAGWDAVPRQGPHAVSVPGMVAGWQEIHRLGARRPLAGCFTDAAALAEEGTAVSPGLARALTARREQVLADPGMRGVFAPDGEVRREGELLRQPVLAETLRRLAEDPDDFYRGRTARSLVDALAAGGGVHELSDFEGYRPVVAPALEVRVGDERWAVAPPPSVGAVLVGIAAAALDQRPDPVPVFEASLRGMAARAAHLGDPGGGADVRALLELRADAGPATAEPPASGDTACVTAADDEGWAVTIVQSVYMTFGAGLLDPASGVLLHNRGSAFSVEPDSVARIRAGARPPHTLCPAIVDRDAVTVVAGCQGGRAQPWILAQLLPDALDPAEDLDELLARPRWIVGAADLGQPALSVVQEPGAPDAVATRARERGVAVVDFPGPADEAGHVQLVRAVRRAGVTALEAASDPRADGTAVLARAASADSTPSIPRRNR